MSRVTFILILVCVAAASVFLVLTVVLSESRFAFIGIGFLVLFLTLGIIASRRSEAQVIEERLGRYEQQDIDYQSFLDADDDPPLTERGTRPSTEGRASLAERGFILDVDAIFVDGAGGSRRPPSPYSGLEGMIYRIGRWIGSAYDPVRDIPFVLMPEDRTAFRRGELSTREARSLSLLSVFWVAIAFLVPLLLDLPVGWDVVVTGLLVPLAAWHLVITLNQRSAAIQDNGSYILAIQMLLLLTWLGILLLPAETAAAMTVGYSLFCVIWLLLLFAHHYDNLMGWLLVGLHTGVMLGIYVYSVVWLGMALWPQRAAMLLLLPLLQIGLSLIVSFLLLDVAFIWAFLSARVAPVLGRFMGRFRQQPATPDQSTVEIEDLFEAEVASDDFSFGFDDDELSK